MSSTYRHALRKQSQKKPQWARGVFAAVAALALTATGSIGAIAAMETPQSSDDLQAAPAAAAVEADTAPEESVEVATESQDTQEAPVESAPVDGEGGVELQAPEVTDQAGQDSPASEGAPESTDDGTEAAPAPENDDGTEQSPVESAVAPAAEGPTTLADEATGTYKPDPDSSNPDEWKPGGKPASGAHVGDFSVSAELRDEDWYLTAQWNTGGTPGGQQGFSIEFTNAGSAWNSNGVPAPDRSQGGAVLFVQPGPGYDLYLCTYNSQDDYSPTTVGGTANAPNCEELGQATVNNQILEIDVMLPKEFGGEAGCPPKLGGTAYVRSWTGENRNVQAWAAPIGFDPPSTCATVRVDKTWVIDGVTFEDGKQPDGFTAAPVINGEQGVFGQVYDRAPGAQPAEPLFQQGDPVTIEESVFNPSYCTLAPSGPTTSLELQEDGTYKLRKGLNTFAFTNTLVCDGYFSIEKKLGEEVPHSAQNTPFSGTYTCVAGEGDTKEEVASGNWTREGAGPALLTPSNGTVGSETVKVPNGAVCSVEETTPLDSDGLPDQSWAWNDPSYDPESVTIAAGSTNKITVTNTAHRVYGHFSIAKSIGPDEEFDTNLAFGGDWTCTYSDEERQNGTWSVTGQGTWNSPDDAQIPLGSMCTVVTENEPESEGPLAEKPWIQWDGYDVDPTGGVLAASAAADAKITVTNKTKTVLGSVIWTKVDEAGGALSGSEWTLEGPDGFTTMSLPDDCDAGGGDTVPFCTVTPPNGFEVGNLIWGEYTLTETAAPVGYRPADPITFEVGPDADPVKLDWELEGIVNRQVEGPELPLTGGQSAAMFVILGGGLLAGSIALAGIKRKWRLEA